MKSPFTGGQVVVMREPRELEYRKESFTIPYHFYKCVDTDQPFTTDKFDEANVIQAICMYHEKYQTPLNS